jgi:hypothetical protein
MLRGPELPPILSNVSADTTDVEQRRCDKRPSHRSRRRLTSCLSELFFTSHMPPPSFTRREGHRNPAKSSIVGVPFCLRSGIILRSIDCESEGYVIVGLIHLPPKRQKDGKQCGRYVDSCR